MTPRLMVAWTRYLASRMGWPGLLGLALAIAGAATEVAIVNELRVDNDGLRTRIAGRRERLAVEPAVTEILQSSTLETLPGGAELMPIVSSVHASARRRHVDLEQGEYAWQRESGGRAARYRMIFPARGGYPQLRGWIADLLAEHPELTIEEFSFRRENIATEQVEARVRLMLSVSERRS